MEKRQSWKEVAEVQGIWRVLLAKKGIVQAGLAVSRAFGDLELKKPKELVTAVPEVKAYEVRKISKINCFLQKFKFCKFLSG